MSLLFEYMTWYKVYPLLFIRRTDKKVTPKLE